jgi:hypothetical protein
MICILLRLHIFIHLHLLLHLLLLLLFLLLFFLIALGLLVSALGVFLVAAAPHRFGVDEGLGRGKGLNLWGLVVHLSRCQLALLCYFLNFLICKAKVNILWFQISVDDFTDTVEIV